MVSDSTLCGPSLHADDTLPAEGSPSQEREIAASRGREGAAEPVRGDMVGRYLVLERIGAGGMGVVFAAFDPELDRKVALKLLHPGRRARGATATERLRREAQALARLSHPGVITVHDVGLYQGQLFVAMEFVDGVDMGVWLRETRRSWQDVAKVMIQAGEGLAAAHEAGVVHRDFKPDNVLVGRDGRVRVVDFGLARRAAESDESISRSDEVAEESEGASDLGRPGQERTAAGATEQREAEIAPTLSLAGAGPVQSEARDGQATQALARLTESGAVMGTPSYMAPEQLQGIESDARSDQFSFCVALHEAIYGERPFAGTSLPELTFNVLEGNVRPLPKEAPVVPAAIRRAIARGLSVDPQQRWPNMRALLEQLSLHPRRRNWKIGVGSAVLLATLGGAWAVAASSETPCQGAERKMTGVWDAAKAQSMRRSFEESGLPYASDVLQWTTAQLDEYAQSWVAMHTDACEATAIRKEQSQELLDRQMLCLERRRKEIRALTSIFVEADAEVVQGAARAVSQLLPLEPCRDREALMASSAPLSGLAAQRLAEIDDLLARSRQHFYLAQYEVGVEVARDALGAARGLEHVASQAQASMWLGRLHQAAGAIDEAESALLEAVWLADAAGDDLTRAGAWKDLVWIAGVRRARYDQADRYRRHAEHALDRAGGDPSVAAELWNNLGTVAWKRGDARGAARFHGRALELRRKHLPSDHPKIAESLLTLALAEPGELEKARAQALEAQKIIENAYGPKHPNTATTLAIRATLAYRSQDYQGAVSMLERAIEINETALPSSEHPALASNRNDLGFVLLELGEYERAASQFERALATRRDLSEAPRTVPNTLTGLGKALHGLGRDEDAIEALREAIDIRTREGDSRANLAESQFALAKVMAAQDPARGRALAFEALTGYQLDGRASAAAEVARWLTTEPGRVATSPGSG